MRSCSPVRRAGLATPHLAPLPPAARIATAAAAASALAPCDACPDPAGSLPERCAGALSRLTSVPPPRFLGFGPGAGMPASWRRLAKLVGPASSPPDPASPAVTPCRGQYIPVAALVPVWLPRHAQQWHAWQACTAGARPTMAAAHPPPRCPPCPPAWRCCCRPAQTHRSGRRRPCRCCWPRAARWAGAPQTTAHATGCWRRRRLRHLAAGCWLGRSPG